MTTCNPSESLLTHHFTDGSSLLWSKPRQQFIYLNQISSWIRTSLSQEMPASKIAEMLAEETTMDQSESASLVRTVSRLDAQPESNLPEPLDTVVTDPANEEGREFPFEQYVPDLTTRSNETRSIQVRTGGITIEIIIRNKEIEFPTGADFFSHLRVTDATESPTHSINIGMLEIDRYWIHSEVTDGFIATTIAALSSLLYWMIYKTVEDSKDWLITLHAGGIAISENKALVICGPSGAGKSTLVAALMSRFKTYLSDEIIPVTRNTHQIYSVGTSVCVKENSWPATSAIFPELKEVDAIERLGKNIKFLPVGREITLPENISANGATILFPTYHSEPEHSASSRQLSTGEILENFLGAGALLGELNSQNQFYDFCCWLDTIDGYELSYNSTNDALSLLAALIRS